MPIRHQRPFALMLTLALSLSSLLPALALGQPQRMRRVYDPPRKPSGANLPTYDDREVRENETPEGSPQRATFVSNSATLPEGTLIRTQIVTKLSSKTAQAGDRLRARVIEPVTDRNGNVLIPAGSIIEGQVQDVARARSRRRPGMIEISFDRLRIGNAAYPIEATLAPATEKDRKMLDEDGRVTQSNGGIKRTAAFIGGGVGIGAVIGYVAGGALMGAGIGAGVGAAALVFGKGKEAEVEPGMKIGAELLAPVKLNQVVANDYASVPPPDDYVDERNPERDRRDPAKDYVYDSREVKNRDSNTDRYVDVPPIPSSKPVVKATPRPSSGASKPVSPATSKPTSTAGRNRAPVTDTPNPSSRADLQLVNVTNLLAERGSDDTVRVSVTGQTPTAGWRLTPESTLQNGVLTIKLYGTPPQSLAAQVISSATTVVVKNDPNREIQRVVVRGATNTRSTIPISREIKNNSGSNVPPITSNTDTGSNANREDLSALGMRIADKSYALLEDYARSMRAWKTNNQYSFENPRDGGTPEAQLLYAFDRLNEAATVFRSPLNNEAKRRAVRDLVNSNAQVNRLWAVVKVAPEFKQRWQDIQSDSNQLAASVPGATTPRPINPNQPRARG